MVRASLVTQMGKNLPAMQETQVWSLGREDPLELGMAIHSSILPGESCGQRSLVGYSPWGCKESDTTEWLSTHTTHALHEPFEDLCWLCPHHHTGPVLPQCPSLTGIFSLTCYFAYSVVFIFHLLQLEREILRQRSVFLVSHGISVKDHPHCHWLALWWIGWGNAYRNSRHSPMQGAVAFMMLLKLAVDQLSPVLSRHRSKILAGRKVQQSAVSSWPVLLGLSLNQPFWLLLSSAGDLESLPVSQSSTRIYSGSDFVI